MIHVLVVEDDARLNQIVCAGLSAAGYAAHGCLNAQEAFDLLFAGGIDVIVSDIMMPDIDGFEFAETVRRVNKTIPILFMSAKDDLPSKKKGFQIGIDDYMVKPVELDEMLFRVKALLRRANIEMSRKITMGNLTLDADAMSAEIDGEEIIHFSPLLLSTLKKITNLISKPILVKDCMVKNMFSASFDDKVSYLIKNMKI